MASSRLKRMPGLLAGLCMLGSIAAGCTMQGIEFPWCAVISAVSTLLQVAPVGCSCWPGHCLFLQALRHADLSRPPVCFSCAPQASWCGVTA